MNKNGKSKKENVQKKGHSRIHALGENEKLCDAESDNSDQPSDESSDEDESDNSVSVSIRQKVPKNRPKSQNNKTTDSQQIFDLTQLTEMLSLNETINHLKSNPSLENPLSEVGTITSIFPDFLVITGIKNSGNVLNLQTCLFFNDFSLMGLIYDIFGKVDHPSYIVRLKVDDLKNIQSKIELNKTKAFYLPGGNESLKSYVEVQKLKNEKFDDASWENDIECPREFQEFSDDEQETSFKNEKKRKKLKKREVKKETNLEIPEKYSKIRELSKNSRSEVPKIQSKIAEKPAPTPDIDIEKLAEQQLQMIAEMEQSKKEETSYKNFFFNDQKVYSKSTSGLPGSCNYISKGQTVRLFQCQVKNHFATENNFSKFDGGDDYLEEMRKINPEFSAGPSKVDTSEVENMDVSCDITDRFGNIQSRKVEEPSSFEETEPKENA